MTTPSVSAPKDGSVRTPVDFKLKPNWTFDSKRRTFESYAGDKFALRDVLPDGSKVLYKTPSLARADAGSLSEAERDLRRYMQLILPRGLSPADYLSVVRSWPSVEDAHIAPQVSLPER